MTDLGTPEITISESEMTFEVAGGDQEMTVLATRDWKVETDADWVAVSPDSGVASLEPQAITVSVLENKGLDRSADLVFTIGLKKKYLTVNQAGPGGSADALVLYSNDFDVSKAQNNSGWPYLDSNYDLWDNKKGTGSATVEYEFGGKMSVRTSGKASNDGSGYSHYAGSGTNKVFFGTAPSTFKINKITLDGTKTDFALSFGGQKYLQDGDSNFSFEEFNVYVSNDSQKWVKLNTSFPEGADIDGDWNLATAKFTVPAGTTQLGLAFVSRCSSAYSIDDVLLEVSAVAGQVIDFSKGGELDETTTGGGTTGDTTAPESKGKKTVEEFIAGADTENYYELTGEVSGFNSTYCSFDITDASGKIYVYSVLSSSKAEWASKIANGGTVTIYGKYAYYAAKSQHEVVDAYIVNYTPGEGEDDVTPPAGEEGEYDSTLSWKLGSNAYDKTSSTAQTATVNGDYVSNVLKLGKSSAGGSATVTIPEGTTKIGFYAIGWKGNTVTLNCKVGDQATSLSIAANDGATGNPKYTITVSDSDYYKLDVPAGVTSMEFSTSGSSNCRAIIFGLKAIKE